MRAHVQGHLGQALALIALIGMVGAPVASAQVRGGRGGGGGRGGAVKTDEGGAARGARGGAVKTDEGAAVATRRGAAVKTDEGIKTANRNTGRVTNTSGEGVEDVAVGRRGAVVQGEEGAVAVSRRGGVAAVEYEDHDAWKVAAGVGAAITIGTMLARPPAAAAPVQVQQASYLYADGVFYTKVMSGEQVSYQVIAAPAGAVVSSLPAGCTADGDIHHCGDTYFQKSGSGYTVVAR